MGYHYLIDNRTNCTFIDFALRCFIMLRCKVEHVDVACFITTTLRRHALQCTTWRRHARAVRLQHAGANMHAPHALRRTAQAYVSCRNDARAVVAFLLLLS